jgi:hypothetical protein
MLSLGAATPISSTGRLIGKRAPEEGHMNASSCRSIQPFLVALALASLIAASAHAENSQTVDGHTVYLGVVPAEIVKGHERGHPEREMHGGAPTRRSQYHIMIVIFETATGKRVTDARLVARVSEPGLAPVQKKLEPMEISGAMSFGNYFAMGGAGPYSIKLAIELPAAKRRLDTEFRNIRTR